MANIRKITLPNGDSYDLMDATARQSIIEDHELLEQTTQIAKASERNLLAATISGVRQPTASDGFIGYSSTYYLTDYGESLFKGNTNDSLTISFDYKLVGATGTNVYFYIQFNGTQVSDSNLYPESSDEIGHYVYTFKPTSEQASYSYRFRIRVRLNNAAVGSSILISNVKLVSGTIEDGYSPAPEEVAYNLICDGSNILKESDIPTDYDYKGEGRTHRGITWKYEGDGWWHIYGTYNYAGVTWIALYGVDTTGNLVTSDKEVYLSLEGDLSDLLQRANDGTELTRVIIRYAANDSTTTINNSYIAYGFDGNPLNVSWNTGYRIVCIGYHLSSAANGMTIDGRIRIKLEKGTRPTPMSDHKAQIYYGTPNETYTGVEVGDYLVDNTNNKSYYWNGNAWVIANDVQIGGRNLMIGTLKPDVNVSEKIPRMRGQGYPTESNGEFSVAEHGFRVTITSATRIYVRFGYTSSYESLNGFEPGETYTLSFDAKWKILSAVTSSETIANMCVWLYDDKETTGTSAIDIRHVFAVISPADRGIDKTGRCEFTFTIPENATRARFFISNDGITGGGNYAVGDYLELANIKLEKGNRATDWTPAPEDVSAEIANAIDDVSIGGRNLLRVAAQEHNSSGYRAYQIPTIDTLENDSYILQLWGVTLDAESTGIKPFWGGGTIPMSTDLLMPDENGYICVKWTPTAENLAHANAQNKYINLYNNPSGHTGCRAKVERWKLEKGNKPTAWSLAPEDDSGDGINLITNTLAPDVSAAAKYPRLKGQTVNTAGRGTATIAEHGIRFTNTTANWQFIRFGNSVVTTLDLLGLEPGEIYTYSGEVDFKVFSGSPASDTEYVFGVFVYGHYGSDSSNNLLYCIPIHRYAVSDLTDRGTEFTGVKFAATFAIPSNVNKLYIDIRGGTESGSTTASHHAIGDYIEVRNMKIERGNTATDWTPAPEDICTEIIELKNLLSGFVVQNSLTGVLTIGGDVDG